MGSEAWEKGLLPPLLPCLTSELVNCPRAGAELEGESQEGEGELLITIKEEKINTWHLLYLMSVRIRRAASSTQVKTLFAPFAGRHKGFCCQSKRLEPSTLGI